MKSSAMLGTAFIFGASLFSASAAFAAEESTASSRVNAINGSGIRGGIFFHDSGNAEEGMSFSGVARGMDPKKTYVSLVYDEGSTAKGKGACLPSDDSLSFGKMVLGVWKVYKNGVGVLQGRTTGEVYASLDLIGTTSVRQDMQPGTALPAEADPNRFVLQACGRVK